MYKCLSFALFFVLVGCSPERQDAQHIVDRTIEAAGGERYLHSRISFDFRELHYTIERTGGSFQMERIRMDSGDTIRDVLHNDGFFREVNGQHQAVPDSMAAKYSNAINSVFYFALLPFGLNDPAVNKEYLGKAQIKGITYDKIKVFFDREGGGTDHEDRFIYWIQPATHTVDYLAYEYHTDGGGMRFREAYHPRTVNGIRFVDYINFRPREKGSVALENMDEAFSKGQLEELSRIELKNIGVERME